MIKACILSLLAFTFCLSAQAFQGQAKQFKIIMSPAGKFENAKLDKLNFENFKPRNLVEEGCGKQIPKEDVFLQVESIKYKLLVVDINPVHCQRMGNKWTRPYALSEATFYSEELNMFVKLGAWMNRARVQMYHLTFTDSPRTFGVERKKYWVRVGDRY